MARPHRSSTLANEMRTTTASDNTVIAVQIQLAAFIGTHDNGIARTAAIGG
jgi:hypothetical protein